MNAFRSCILMALLMACHIAQSAETGALSESQKTYVLKHVKNVASADAKTREDAQKRLAGTLPFSLDELHEQRASSKDPEQRSALDRLMDGYPPERKALTPDEIKAAAGDDERLRTLVVRLYDEYLAEEKRTGAELASGKTMVRGNTMHIARDLLKLMPAALPHFQNLVPINVVGRSTRPVGPQQVLERTLIAYTQSLKTPESKQVSAKLRKDLQALDPFSKNKPRDEQAWKTWCAALKDSMEKSKREAADTAAAPELVSVIYQHATVTDVLESLALQRKVFLFYDPPALAETLKQESIDMRIEDAPWDDAMAKSAKAGNVQYELREGDEPGLHISRKK